MKKIEIQPKFVILEIEIIDYNYITIHFTKQYYK